MSEKNNPVRVGTYRIVPKEEYDGNSHAPHISISRETLPDGTTMHIVFSSWCPGELMFLSPEPLSYKEATELIREKTGIQLPSEDPFDYSSGLREKIGFASIELCPIHANSRPNERKESVLMTARVLNLPVTKIRSLQDGLWIYTKTNPHKGLWMSKAAFDHWSAEGPESLRNQIGLLAG